MSDYYKEIISHLEAVITERDNEIKVLKILLDEQRKATTQFQRESAEAKAALNQTQAANRSLGQTLQRITGAGLRG